MKCSICSLEENDCPMLTGEMNMCGAPKELNGRPNRRNAEKINIQKQL